MFSSLKRSSYKVIEEEDQSQMSSGSGHVHNMLPLTTEKHEEEEDEPEHEEGRSMFESAPPINHGIAVSFKCGENDPELPKSNDDSGQWDHIKDIDQFFAYIYEYYQQKGFTCIALRYLFSLLRFAFVVIFSTFLLQCIDYDVLFYNRNTTMDGALLPPKRGIQDAFIPKCYSRLNPIVVFTLFLAILFWIVHFFRICYRLIQFYEIKRFFTTQLQISNSEMYNLSWPQLVQKLCIVQQRLHLIVNRNQITSLDIYQRIFRHKNYIVGLVYHDILPPSIRLPMIGHVRYLSTGLRFNMEWFLFWGPWSPWKGPYALKDEFKDVAMLSTISQTLQRTVAIMALANLIFFPFVFIYQVLFSFFTYAEHFQRDPNVFGMRKYSNYGREKLRHFNEMDHELDARLNRSYEFAARYTDQFISPLAKIIARNIAFVAASFFVVFCGLTAIDEDTLKIEHVTTMMTLTGGIVLLCRAFIPNENLVYCQQFLMRQIVANIHYAPRSWLRDAHSTEIHREFTQIFRLKMEILVEELLSPILTPFILYFSIYKRVPEIVTFFHENTVTVEGLGDVCSLAQMDIARDGDVRLASLNQSILIQPKNGNNEEGGKSRNSCGKAELSLLNFAAQNPEWIPPKASAEFIRNVRELVALEISNTIKQNSGEEDPIGKNNNCQQQIPPNSSMDAKTMAFILASSQMSLGQMEKSQKGIDAGMIAPSALDGLINYNFAQRNVMPIMPYTAEGMGTSGFSTTISSNEVNNPAMSEIPLQTFSTTKPFETASNNDGSNANQTHSPNRRHSQNHSQTSHSPSSSSILMNNSQPQSSPFLLSNSRLFASSFIAPSPLAAIVQPRVVQESNLRATEMSLNALAVNHMLFLNTTMEHHLHQSRQNRANRMGYGSIFMGSGGNNNSIRRGYGGMGTTLVMDSLAESNIWGVPAETSQLVLGRMRGPPTEGRQNINAPIQQQQNVVDEDDAPLPLREEGKRRLLH